MTHIPSHSQTCSSQEERGREGKQIRPMSLTLCQIRSVYRQKLSFCFSDLPCPVPPLRYARLKSQWKVFPAKAITALQTHLVNLSVSWMHGMHLVQWHVILQTALLDLTILLEILFCIDIKLVPLIDTFH